jgi:NitT/TauT family transport system substrate-binding protein
MCMTLRPTLRLAAGFGLLAAAMSSQAGAQTPLKLSLDTRLDGPAALFLVPKERGYFREEGIELAIEEGAAALEPITRIAQGTADFGFADINALIRYHDQNPSAPVKAVFMVYSKPPFAIVGRKSRGISDPKSLEDKHLGAPPMGASYEQWPIFAKLNHIDTGKVILEKIGVPVRAPMLAAGEIDAALGYSYRLYVDLKERGVPPDDVVMLEMANYGLTLYGSAIMVSAKLAAERPAIVEAFLRAFTKGLKDTIHNPLIAVEALLKHDHMANGAVELERLRMALKDNIVTGEVRADGLGAIDGERLTQAIAQIALTHSFKGKPKVDDVFDPAFLPPLAERKLNGSD